MINDHILPSHQAHMYELKFMAFSTGRVAVLEALEKLEELVPKYAQNVHFGEKSFNILIEESILKALERELDQMGYVTRKYAFRVIQLKRPSKGRRYRLLKTVAADTEVSHYMLYAYKKYRPQ